MRDHAWALFEVDPGNDVRHVGFEGLGGGATGDLADDGERINFTFAAHGRPIEAIAAAFVAPRTARPHPGATGLAAPSPRFLLRRRIPKRFSCGGDCRERFFEYPF